MDLCSYKNLSIGVYKLPEFNFVQDKNNQNMNKILINFYKNIFGLKNIKENKCKFVEIVEYGKKLSNGSYTGLLKHFFDKTIDLCSKTEIYFKEDYDLIDFTSPSSACVSRVAQIVSKPETKKIDASSVLTNNLGLFIQILISTFLVIITTKFFIYQNSKKKHKLTYKFFLSNYDKKIKKNFSKIGLVLIFFELNLFIYFVLISNNIKTNKVIFDTNFILDTKQKILDTNKISCWVKSEFDYDFAKKSEPGTFLNRIFMKRFYSPNENSNEKIECSFSPEGSIVAQLRLFQAIPMQNFFFFMNSFILKFLFALIGKFIPKDAAYMGDKNFQEFIFVFVFRKTLEKDLKQFLLKNFIKKLENGYLKNYMITFEDYFTTMVKEDRRIYSSADEYSQDFMKIENVKISYFEKSFIFLILIYSLVLMVFLFNKLNVKFLKFLFGKSYYDN